MSKKVIELIRVSTEGQAGDDRASIPSQRAVNRRTAERYHLEIVRSIEIVDVSGAQILLSPEMQELLRLIASPDIHGVVAREFSRIMRPENYSDFAILQAFADTRTIFYLPDGPIDLSSKSGRILGTLQAVIAGNERIEFLEKVWSSKEEKRRAGESPSSAICLPFGVSYDRSKGKEGWHYTAEAERVREAFNLFLAGDTSYVSVGQQVGIQPFTLRNLLRNPIYTGWRVIDKRRDPSVAAHRTKKGGRQGDRPKINRAPEDVIRVKVINEPLVSEEVFNRVQQIVNLKRSRSWRHRPDYERRFTYNSFLTCAVCGSLIYTKFRRRDYYVCKDRKGCDTRYMRRERLESELDSLLSKRLTDEGFLEEITSEMRRSARQSSNQARVERLQGEVERLKAKRGRILEAFYDGTISSQERDLSLAKIVSEIAVNNEVLLRERPAWSLSVDMLVNAFSPFYEWQFLKRTDKRRLLSTLTPDIRVADYRVHGLYLTGFVSEVNHTGKGSLRIQA